MSAAATSKELKKSAPGAKTQLKRATSDWLHGSEAKDRTLQKAVEGKREVAAKRKHVRNLVLRCWRENGMSSFYRDAARLPLDSDAVMCFRTLISFHKILTEGPPNALLDAHHRLDWLEGLASIWAQRPAPGGYRELIPRYCAFLKTKINFHATHSQFNGALSLDEFLQNKERSGARVARKFASDVVQRCLALHQSLLTLTEDLYALEHTLLTEAKISVFIPVIGESWAIYQLTYNFLQRMAAESHQEDQELGFLIQQFYEQYPRIRHLYEDTATIQYVTSVIKVPSLPRSPPEFRFSGGPPKEKLPSPRPVTPPPAPVTFEPARPVIPMPTAPVVPVPTYQPPPMPTYQPPPYTPPPAVLPAPQPWQFQVNPSPFSSTPASWATFDSSPRMSSVFQPYTPPVTTLDSQRLNMSSLGSSLGSFSELASAALSLSSSGRSSDLLPAPEQVPPVVQTPPPTVATVESPEAKKPQISYDDLKSRFTQLQVLFKKERARGTDLEGLLKQAQDEAALWKRRYEQLSAEHETLKRQHNELSDQFDALESKVISLERAAEAEKRRNALGQLDSARENLERSLLALLGTSASPTSDSPSDLLAATSDLLEGLAALSAATTPEERLAAIRRIADATNQLLLQVKAVASKTEDPVARQNLLRAAEFIGTSLNQLLMSAQSAPDDLEALGSASARVRQGLEALMEATKGLIASAAAEVDHGDELADTATRELLQAAAAIDAAARSLAATKAMEKPKLSLNDIAISDAIIDAAMAIATATKRLVAQATAVQKENVAQGRARGEGASWYLKNAKWAQGLISAAKSVAEGTQMLVHSANETAYGRVQEEALIASSMSVSASTAQLVAAARVRSDPNSPHQQGLETAAKAVSQSTSNLVAAAKGVSKQTESVEEVLDFGGSAVQKMRAQQEAQMKVLELQKQLEQAQVRLFRLNQSQYSDAGRS